MSLRVKLFTAFFALIVIPLFVLGVSAYVFISGMIEDKYAQQAEISLRALSGTVRFIFLEMNKVTDSTIATQAVQEILNSPLYSQRDVTEINYLALNEVQQKFRELLVYHPSVSFGLMYILSDERMIRIYANDKFDALPFAKFKEQPVYEKVFERNGYPLWVGPFEVPELTGTNQVFTQIRLVKDIDTLQDKGILLVQIKNSGLEDIFRQYQFHREKYETRFMIVNGGGLVLFDSSGEGAGQRLADHAEGDVPLSGGFQSERLRFAGTDSVLSSFPIGLEDWRLVSVTSWSSLSREINRYAGWVAAVTAMCVLSALVFLLFGVHRVARTIVRIVRFMRRVEGGELNIRFREGAGNDEVAILARGMNNFVARIQQLLEQVKREQRQKTEAELRLLQAQIKPHFLFNTLESINVLAMRNDGRKVSQMVLRLGRILRTSFQEQEEIPLSQEIEHLKDYLDIQKFRFNELFDYELDIPDAMRDVPILKLTLQPLVENSIQHGFEGIEYPGMIRIEGTLEKGRAIITVSDNGIGIDHETLARLQYAAEDEMPREPEERPVPSERRGLGLRSVADRLRIVYGPEYGLWICSMPGQGTTIRCVVPAGKRK